MKLSRFTLASAVTLGALGASALAPEATVVSATGFENYFNSGVQTAESLSPRTGDNDDGNESTGGSCWFTTEASEDTVVTAYNGDARTGTKWPGDFTSAGDYFLKISNSSPLFRTFAVYTTSTGTAAGDWPTAWGDINWVGNGTIPAVNNGNNLWIDMLVQFTPSEETPAYDATTDKLVVFMNADSNLCVYAGQYSDFTESAATVFETATALNVGQWYRLTVKMLPDLLEPEEGQEQIPAFIVYIDGVEVTSATAAFTSAFAAEAAEYYADGTAALLAAGKVFPSLRNAAYGEAGLQAIGFKGEGAVDDLVATYATPEFDGSTPPASTIDFTLNWGTGVSAVYYAIDGGAAVAASNGVLIENVDSSATVVVTAEAAPWYQIDGASIPATVADDGDYTITASLAEYDLTLTAGNGVTAFTGSTPETNNVTKVKLGDAVTLNATVDSTGWYKSAAFSGIVGGTVDAGVLTVGGEVAPAAVTVTAAAEQIDPQNDIGAGTTAADVGITGGAFASADQAELQKVVGWAETNGASPADVSAMTFADYTAYTSLEQQYLLNTDADGLAAALADAETALHITAIEKDGDNWVVTYANGGATYANGTIEVKQFSDPKCLVEDADGNFYRAFLVK